MPQNNLHTNFPLHQLMERLKIQASFAISPTEIMRVQRLLQEQPQLLLSAAGRKSLKLLLAPLLCRNEAEQQIFYKIFDDYIEKDLQLSKEEQLEQKAIAEIQTAQESAKNWRHKWLPLLASLGLALVIIPLAISKYQQQPATFNISFENLIQEVKVGDTLRMSNTSDTGAVHFSWHILDETRSDTLHTHKERDLEWIAQTGGNTYHKKIQLHAHHAETKQHLGNDEHDITILCNTLQVGSIAVLDTALQPNRPLQFNVEVAPNPHLTYRWEIDKDTFDTPAPTFTFAESGDYDIKVLVKDTFNTEGFCEKEVNTTIKIKEKIPDNPITLSSFELLEEPPNIEYQLKYWYWPLLFFLFGLSAFNWWKWWKRPDPNDLAKKADDIALKNRFKVSDKNPYSIPFAPAETKIQAAKVQFDIAQSLRNRQQGNRKILDIPATLNATIEGAGFPSVQYRYSSQPTDYLVLIDLQSADSHLARLFQYLATMLQDQDVLLDIFYYKNDFQRCWNDHHPKGIHLGQLHQLYPLQRLIVMGDAHSLVESADAQQGLHALWNRQLQKWSHRLLLTPLPIVSWTYVEARLFQLFPIFPADLQGIMQAVQFLEAESTMEDLPTTLKEWSNQLQKSRIEVDVIRRWRTLAQHEVYLKEHPEVLRWLKALIVYPTPTWNVTIAIGKALGVRVTYDNLLLLSRIPWLQDGNMKPRLWRSFSTELSIADEQVARTAVKTELETVRKETTNAFAGQQLELQLAIQDFALAPENIAHQNTLIYLKQAGLLPPLHVEELDKIVARHIPNYRQGNELGETLQNYLQDAKQAQSRTLTKPFWTKHLWWALATSLLSLFGFIGLGIKGDYLHNESKESPKSEAARLNNLAVNYFHDEGNSDFLDKSTFTINYLNRAITLDSSFLKAHLNLQKLNYNEGVEQYQSIINGNSTSSLSSTKPIFKKVLNYNGPRIDSVSYAAMYGLANVHHLISEQDSTCLLLDTLRKVPNLSFLDSIPNLFNQAAYCIPTDNSPAIDTGVMNIQIAYPTECLNQNNCVGDKQWTANTNLPAENTTWTILLVDKNRNIVKQSVRSTVTYQVENGQTIYPKFTLFYRGKEIVKEGKAITFKDCQAPTIVVNDEVQATLGTAGTAIINTTDLIESYADNCTNATDLLANLRVWYRVLGTEPTNIEDIKNLPTSLQLDCKNLGQSIFKCYVFDESNNWSEGDITVILEDNSNSCNTDDTNAGSTQEVVTEIDTSTNPVTELPNTTFPIPQTIQIQGDTFSMGCTPEQAEFCRDNEKPAHTVKVETFRMGKFEVTNEEYVAFLNEKGNQEEGGKTWVNLSGEFGGVVCGIEQIKGKFQVKEGLAKHPMIYVSWYGAKAYCQWLKEKTGKNWRLPSEAEWEFAARGGTKSINTIYSGSNDIDGVAWYSENSDDKTHPVGQKQANELGLYDMSGNVWEWIEDCWHDDYANAPETATPWLESEKGDCGRRVLRGGSWSNDDYDCRVSDRFRVVPDIRNSYNGFRVAQD